MRYFNWQFSNKLLNIFEDYEKFLDKYILQCHLKVWKVIRKLF